MVLRTFTNGAGTGLWSAAGNWDTGVPVDTDTFNIPLGLTCDFDVDQSGMATGMRASVINGELRASAGGNRYLKMAGNLTGSGVLRAGTSEASPFAAGSTFTIGLTNNSWLRLTGPASYQLFCREPTYRYARLTANAGIGDTVLSVDTNLTGDIWAAGDTVMFSTGSNRVIAVGGIAAGTITLTAGLTAALTTGAHVALFTRNVAITVTGDYRVIHDCAGNASNMIAAQVTAYLFCDSGGYGLHLGGAWDFSGSGVYRFPLAAVAGIVKAPYGAIRESRNCTVESMALIFGSTWNMLNNDGLIVRGHWEGGGIWAAGLQLDGATLFNAYVGLDGICTDTTFGGTTTPLQNPRAIWLKNCLLSPAVECTGYNNTQYRRAWDVAESLDHDQVAGAYRAWLLGGTITSQAVTVPPGYTQADQLALASATLPTFRQWALAIQPGEQVEVTAQLRKDAAMTYRPRIQVIDQAADPLVDGVGPALAETIMTDSVDTWETLTATWTNSGTTERRVYVRVLGMNATGNAYAVVNWEVMMGTVATNVSTLLTRLTETRAEYLDNLSAGAVATTTNVSDAQAAIEDAIAEIPTVTPPTVEEIRAEMDANSTQLAAIVADTGTDGVVVATASKTGYALSATGVQAIWDALSSALTTAGSIGKRLVDYLTGDVFARLGAPAGASVSADLAAVDTVVDAIYLKTALITTGTALTIESPVDGETITLTRDVMLSGTLTATASDPSAFAARTACWLTVKGNLEDDDSEATLQIEETAGLLYIAGGAPTAAVNGSLTITMDGATVSLAIVLKAVEAAKLSSVRGLHYDVKWLDADGQAHQLCTGVANVQRAVTRAIS